MERTQTPPAPALADADASAGEFRTRFTTRDLELFPDNGNVYEIIDGELFMSRMPHYYHQSTSARLYSLLLQWSDKTHLGEPNITVGVVLDDYDNVAPDVVWTSTERLAVALDEQGHLTALPELVAEVLSAGAQNESRDRDAKLKLYQARGALEYWIVDWRLRQVEVYRRERARLTLIGTLLKDDELTSPLLPGFACKVSALFG